ncbi:MAG: hypothetical protein K940chlam6_00032 [Chlamydiae bacterium]|nr:hypothetical protein [Chlamydiota bacterium]
MRKIKTIFFDLGGVLINFSHEKMCHNIAHFCGLELDLVKTHLMEKNLGEDYERGTIDSHTVHEYFMQLAKHPLDFHGLLKAAARNTGSTVTTLKGPGSLSMLSKNETLN